MTLEDYISDQLSETFDQYLIIVFDDLKGEIKDSVGWLFEILNQHVT